jgi:hypothetical protein
VSIQALISQNFVVLSAGMEVAAALSLADEVGVDFVIISDPVWDGYGLADRNQLAHASHGENRTLRELGIPMVPVVDISDLAGAPQPAIVQEDGALVGVWASSVKCGPVPRGATTSAETVQPAATGSMLLGADFPKRVQMGAVASLLAWVGAAGEGAWASGPLDVGKGESVDLVVQPRKGFELAGPGEGTVCAGDGEVKPFRARLRATDEGPGLVRVFAFREGVSLGTLSLTPEVAAAAETVIERQTAPVELSVGSDQVLPDLSLLVMERRNAGQRELEFLVTATRPELGLYLHRFGPVALKTEPLAFFNDFFADIEGAGEMGGTRPEEVEAVLAAKGAHLFENMIPAPLRERLWELRDRIGTVQISSDEPWIPWELCRLTGMENGEWKEDAFFCERYEITRWFPGTQRRAHLTLANIALVAPADSGLAAVEVERAYFDGLKARGMSVTQVPARMLEVQRAFATGTYDGFHFSGHGVFREANPDRSPIVLENDERLEPESISGRTRNLGRSCPLVFLNACQVGRPGMGLVDVGGWAKRFLDAGAGAFVGAYWSVYDQPASAFAKALYDKLLEGVSFGVAVRAARQAIRKAGDPTWLAYTVYADPHAMVLSGREPVAPEPS